MTDRITTGSGESAGSGKELDDIMFQDPYCEVYFPKQSGYHVKNEGEDLYFCSKECRDKFMAIQLGDNNT
jgi:YHS domain-containing protein